MNLTPAQALEAAIEAAGGVTKLAQKIGAKPQVVVHWRRRGVPAARVLAIETASCGAVSRQQLRPDLYPAEMAA